MPIRGIRIQNIAWIAYKFNMPATLFRIPDFSIINPGDVFGFRSGLQRFESSQDLALNQAESVLELYRFGFFEPEAGLDPMS